MFCRVDYCSFPCCKKYIKGKVFVIILSFVLKEMQHHLSFFFFLKEKKKLGQFEYHRVTGDLHGEVRHRKGK